MISVERNKMNQNDGMDKVKEIVGIEEASRITGYSKKYLYKLTSEKRIPHYKPQGGKLYFLIDELEAFLLRGRVLADYEVAEQANRKILALSRR
jgi:excisionase family DNA binding protein